MATALAKCSAAAVGGGAGGPASAVSAEAEAATRAVVAAARLDSLPWVADLLCTTLLEAVLEGETDPELKALAPAGRLRALHGRMSARPSSKGTFTTTAASTAASAAASTAISGRPPTGRNSGSSADEQTLTTGPAAEHQPFQPRLLQAPRGEPAAHAPQRIVPQPMPTRPPAQQPRAHQRLEFSAEAGEAIPIHGGEAAPAASGAGQEPRRAQPEPASYTPSAPRRLQAVTRQPNAVRTMSEGADAVVGGPRFGGGRSYEQTGTRGGSGGGAPELRWDGVQLPQSTGENQSQGDKPGWEALPQAWLAHIPPTQRPFFVFVEAADSHRLNSHLSRSLVGAISELDPCASAAAEAHSNHAAQRRQLQGALPEHIAALCALAALLGHLDLAAAAAAGLEAAAAFQRPLSLDLPAALAAAQAAPRAHAALVRTVPWVLQYLRLLAESPEAAGAAATAPQLRRALLMLLRLPRKLRCFAPRPGGAVGAQPPEGSTSYRARLRICACPGDFAVACAISEFFEIWPQLRALRRAEAEEMSGGGDEETRPLSSRAAPLPGVALRRTQPLSPGGQGVSKESPLALDEEGAAADQADQEPPLPLSLHSALVPQLQEAVQVLTAAAAVPVSGGVGTSSRRIKPTSQQGRLASRAAQPLASASDAAAAAASAGTAAAAARLGLGAPGGTALAKLSPLQAAFLRHAPPEVGRAVAFAAGDLVSQAVEAEVPRAVATIERNMAAAVADAVTVGRARLQGTAAQALETVGAGGWNALEAVAMGAVAASAALILSAVTDAAVEAALAASSRSANAVVSLLGPWQPATTCTTAAEVAASMAAGEALQSAAQKAAVECVNRVRAAVRQQLRGVTASSDAAAPRGTSAGSSASDPVAAPTAALPWAPPSAAAAVARIQNAAAQMVAAASCESPLTQPGRSPCIRCDTAELLENAWSDAVVGADALLVCCNSRIEALNPSTPTPSQPLHRCCEALLQALFVLPSRQAGGGGGCHVGTWRAGAAALCDCAAAALRLPGAAGLGAGAERVTMLAERVWIPVLRSAPGCLELPRRAHIVLEALLLPLARSGALPASSVDAAAAALLTAAVAETSKQGSFGPSALHLLLQIMIELIQGWPAGDAASANKPGRQLPLLDDAVRALCSGPLAPWFRHSSHWRMFLLSEP